jgi:peptidoglycan/xylan/chitin deacetylase (PgdA/CDA1 family)
MDIAAVKMRQHLGALDFSIRTRGKWGLRKLAHDPPAHPHRDPSACLLFRRRHASRQVRACLPASKEDGLRLALVEADGSVGHRKTASAEIHRDGPSEADVRVGLSGLGLRPGVYIVHATTDWKGAPCADTLHPRHGDRCIDRVPGRGGGRLRLKSLQATGCIDRHPRLVRRGGNGSKKLALTFDDGPGTYTPQVLSILTHFHVHSTFFEIGDNVVNYPRFSRAVLEQGSELGDHSLHHESYPGTASMRETNRRILAATGFTPCLFRPPGGAENSAVVSSARSLGMSTVIWDVDPQDWSRPGTGAIESRVLGSAHGGSIVLMHDGGGDRSQTVAALPTIIRTLKHRGYRLVTVSSLLGYPSKRSLEPSGRLGRPALPERAAPIVSGLGT